MIAPDAMFISRSEEFGALTLRPGCRQSLQYREFAVAGGLMSYGGNSTEAVRLLGIYTGRVLKGEKPADLPVYSPPRSSWSSTSRPPKRSVFTVPNTLIVTRRRGDRIEWRCPLLALSGHAELHCTCPLLGVKRTSR